MERQLPWRGHGNCRPAIYPYGKAAMEGVIGGGIQAPLSIDWSGQKTRRVSSKGPVGVGNQFAYRVAGGVFWTKMSIDPSAFGVKPVSLPTS